MGEKSQKKEGWQPRNRRSAQGQPTQMETGEDAHDQQKEGGQQGGKEWMEGRLFLGIMEVDLSKEVDLKEPQIAKGKDSKVGGAQERYAPR